METKNEIKAQIDPRSFDAAPKYFADTVAVAFADQHVLVCFAATSPFSKTADGLHENRVQATVTMPKEVFLRFVRSSLDSQGEIEQK